MLSLSISLVACGPGERMEPVDAGPGSPVSSDDTVVQERWNVGFSSADQDALTLGWATPETAPDTGTSFTWATALTAAVQLRLFGEGSGTLHLRCEPFVYDPDVTQTIEVGMNDTSLGRLTLEPRMSDYALEVPAGAFKDGDNTVTFGFAYAETPRAHGLGDDTRPLAARFEVVSLTRHASVRFSSWESDALVAGWGEPEVSPETGKTFRWAVAPTARLRLNVDSVASSTLRVRCDPFVYDSDIAQTLAIRVNDKDLDRITLAPEMASYALPVPADMLVEGGNVVTFEFAYAESPQAHQLGQDARRLAARFERVSLSPDSPPTGG